MQYFMITRMQITSTKTIVQSENIAKKKMEAGGLIAGIICLFIFCIVFAVCVDGKNEENETRNSEIEEEEATEPVATVPSRVVNFF